MTALLMGQPRTKEVAESSVTSDTSAQQVDSHTSDRGTCNAGGLMKAHTNVSKDLISEPQNETIKLSKSDLSCGLVCNWAALNIPQFSFFCFVEMC